MSKQLRKEIDSIRESLTPTNELDDPAGFIDGKPVSCKELVDYLIALSRAEELKP